MKCLILQHTLEEAPGSLKDWLDLRGQEYSVCRLYDDQSLPPIPTHQWLIILGGPMNVDEDGKYPWLTAEKAYIREWLASGKPTLGLCLGAQLIARALDTPVKKNHVREIGFHGVTKTDIHHPYFADWPKSSTVFQWHEDTFDLPPGAQLLMTSQACRNQLFAYNRNVIGFQFHPESTESWITSNYDGFRHNPDEPFVQNWNEGKKHLNVALPDMRKHFFAFLDMMSTHEP